MKLYQEAIRRANFEYDVIKQFRKIIPTYDQYLSQYRTPVYPKIVLLSNLKNTEQYLENFLPQYRYLGPAIIEEDMNTARKLADEALTPHPQNFYNGVFIKNFPSTAAQALLLDKFLNGVNLAIYINSDAQYKQQISQVLQYYSERGSLLEIDHQEELTLDTISNVQRLIKQNIKLSEL